jgi:CelD/BcsL family acetyltransferase involved in cellulose biosynthesis
MSTALSVDVLQAGALTRAEQDAWRAFTAASPSFRSPFFSLDFALAADGVVPEAAVAVVHRAGEIAGFLPFQKRGGIAQPLAAPLSDYHGVITAPGVSIDLAEVIRLTGAGAYRFNGLVGPEAPQGGRAFPHASLRADISAGLEGWLAGRPHTRKFFKDKERARRAAERDLGPLEFQLEDDTPGLLPFVIAHKRDQYRRTARHDVFGCGWTGDLLRRLWDERTPEFGARISTLRAGGRLIAAEFGLRAGPVRHIWFPVYDPDLSRWGPGTLLMIAMFKAAADDVSLSELDFGREGEAYKRYYADPGEMVYEGAVAVEAWRKVSTQAADATLAAPAFKRVAEIRERMRRRFDIITACETNSSAWLGGAADALVNAARRGPAVAQNA